MNFTSESQKKDFIKKVLKNKGKLPDIFEILKLMKRGYNQTQIADIYGVTRQSVSKLLNKLKK